MQKQNGFTRGICRALDFGAKNKKTLNITVRYADSDAIAKDWENVGKSIKAATRKYEARACK